MAIHYTSDAAYGRGFGQVFATIFGVIALWPLTTGGLPRWWWLAAAAALALAAMIMPRHLAPAGRLWLAFGARLHRITSPVMLGIVFFGMITPGGWLLRRSFGRDPLCLRRRPETGSYWRTGERAGAGRFRDQF